MKDRGNGKPGPHLTDTNHDTETAMMSYPVNVICLAQAKPSRARAEAGTKPNRKPPARAPRAPSSDLASTVQPARHCTGIASRAARSNLFMRKIRMKYDERVSFQSIKPVI